MEESFKMAISSVSKVVNICAAKNVAFPLAVLLLILQGVQFFSFGDSCKRLLHGGSLVDGNHWQPDGCMLHHYKVSDSLTRKCLTHRRIVFVGDSRQRELFFLFVDGIASKPFERPTKKHSNIVFQEDSLEVMFYWVPLLNDTAIELFKSWTKNPEMKPQVIVIASTTHTIKSLNGSLEGLNQYQKNLTKLVPYMTILNDVSIIWMMQELVEVEKLKADQQAITEDWIYRYNEAAHTVLEDEKSKSLLPNVKVMWSNTDVAKQTLSPTTDGIHLSVDIILIQVQLLLNLVCNDIVRPIDGSCCQRPPSINAAQVVAFFFGGLSVIVAILWSYLDKSNTSSSRNPESGGSIVKNGNDSKFSVELFELVSAAARMSCILLYFYICDRTNIFMKSNKYYSHIRFFIPLLYVIFLGMFGIDQSKDSGMLNRNQTDEWKGWMQLIILIYHITGASVNVAIYMHIRLLVAMYLFMTGYGHFSYFWNKGDFSFHRMFSVIFRLNFLTVMLCIVMNRSYQFYYFVPLCTFWYMVLFIALAMWPRAFITPDKPTSNAEGATEFKNILDSGARMRSPTIVMCFKLFALTFCLVMLFMSQEWFTAMFSWWPLAYLFELNGSAREWWFRCKLDRFAMLHGAFFCFAYIVLKRMKIVDDSKQGCLMPMKSSLLIVTGAVGSIVLYTLWALSCTSKVECNEIHSYASVLPITSFILIRNIPGYFRSVYSSFFAWFGKISLELFIGQYHIWLAADTKGILVLGPPKWSTANMVVATFIFVCVAHEISQLTGTFAKFVVPPSKEDYKKVTLRFLVIAVVLITFAFLSNWRIN